MHVAVLGAGLSGVCTALELTEAGCTVDLIDRCNRPLTRASRASEGKIHLGYVYAMDESLRTARTMLEGAGGFHRLISPWVGEDFWEKAVSDPFQYAVPRDSLMSLDALRRHFSEVSRLAAGVGPDLLAAGSHWREMPRKEWEDIYDPEQILTVLESGEIAVDTPLLCERLRDAVDGVSNLRFHPDCEVEEVTETRTGFQVEVSRGATSESIRCDSVINAMWEQRLPVDSDLGLDTSRPMIHRYKVGLRTRAPEVREVLPSVTFLVGAYGDAVAGVDNAYVSWYPAGLLSEEVGLTPSAFDISLSQEQSAVITRESLAGLARLMPGVAQVLNSERFEWELAGGYISAWGDTGILDPASELHQRFAIGVHSRGAYHSIDTGKLTTAPLFAHQACERVLGCRAGVP